MGIGGAIPGYVLAATGYVANQAQTDTAKMGIIMNNILIPSIITLIAALVFGPPALLLLSWLTTAAFVFAVYASQTLSPRPMHRTLVRTRFQ
jgi:hypothetical protein